MSSTPAACTAISEIVAFTREGNLFVWDTPAPANEAALPWSGFGRDRRNTQNQASGVSALAGPVDALDGLAWTLEDLRRALIQLGAELPLAEARLLQRSPAPFLIPLAQTWVAADQELRVAQALPGIEWGLRLPSHPIAELAPLVEPGDPGQLLRQTFDGVRWSTT